MPRKQTFDDWAITLQYYVEGYRNYKIGKLLHISPSTVTARLKRIREYTNTRHITAAYRIMLLRGHIKLQ